MGFRVCDFERQAVTSQEVTVWCSVHPYGLKLLTRYKEHGEGFFSHNDEDISFVLYDRRKNIIIAFRDFFGVSPLFYSLSFCYENAVDSHLLNSVNDQLFGFSLHSIIEQKDFLPQIDHLSIADYFDLSGFAGPVSDRTFFSNVKRLLPGEALIIKENRAEWKNVSRLDLEKYKDLNTEEFIEKFRTLFLGSVAGKIKDFDVVGANLSGGLDSSSVCCAAAKERSVRSFYLNTGTEDAEEENYVKAVITRCAAEGTPLIHTTIDAGRKAGKDLMEIIRQTAQPERMVLPSGVFKQLVETASEQNVEIVLSGHGGDQIVGYGFEYLDELFEARSWEKLSSSMVRSMHYYSANYSFLSNGWDNLDTEARSRHYAVIFFARKWRKSTRKIKAAFEYLWILKRYFHVRPDEVYAILKGRKKNGLKVPLPAGLVKSTHKKATVNTEVKTLDIEALVNDYTLSPLQKQHLRNYFNEMGVAHNEELDVLFTNRSMKTAYPFLDKELLELTLHVPLALRFDNGRGRGVLRQALKDYLPEEVLNRTDKGEFSEFGLRAFQSVWEEFSNRPDAHTHKIWEIIDKGVFDKNLRIIYDEKYHPRQKTTHILLASRVIYLAIWFDNLDKIKESSDWSTV